MFYYFAIIANLLFLLISSYLKLNESEKPLTKYARIHLYFSVVYVLTCIGYQYFYGLPALDIFILEFIIGLFMYFGIYYAIIVQLFSIAFRSVTVAMISYGSTCKEPMSVEVLQKLYENSFGNTLKDDRLLNSISAGLITKKDNLYTLTNFGFVLGIISITMLKLWNLRRLGESGD